MKKVKDIDKEELDTEEEKHRYWPYLLLFMILLFFCVFGITYSIYKGDDSSIIEVDTGEIVFTYSDVGGSGNGISISDAVPIPDSQGKNLMGSKQYFDFYITATTNDKKVHYQLLLKKDNSSTLSDDSVKVYLTQTMGSYEDELLLTKVSNLEKKEVNNKEYYLLYEKTLDENLENYSDSFRFRMWVDENSTDYSDKLFSVKIDVYAYQVEE